MSDPFDSNSSDPRRPLPPERHASPPAPPAQGRGCSFGGCLLGISLLLNFLTLVVVLLACLGAMAGGIGEETTPATEQYHSGNKKAGEKVAIVSVDGVIMEGLVGHVQRQIDTAARDKQVKAVVLRINSPGGTITASEDLHRRVTKLRDGNPDKDYPAKPLIVSMGAIAASGGYYIAVPAKKIFAEKTTTTASIGVYGSFPNAKELGDKYGFHMRTIKAGEIKDAGSPLKDLSPKEEQVLQDMVDEAYLQFLGVIEKDRPKLTKSLMMERFSVKPVRPDPNLPNKAESYTRYRADGGTFFGPRALELGLVDVIGTLDDAVKAASDLAELDTYKAVKYHKPTSLQNLLMGKTAMPGDLLDPERLESALSPRLWFLAPGYEGAAFVAAGRAAK